MNDIRAPKNMGAGEVLSQVLVKETPNYNVWEITSVIGFEAEVLNAGDDPEEAAKFARDINKHCKPQPVTIRSAYTKTGEYIGEESKAAFLCDDKSIVPECRPGHQACSIGFCQADQKWYGWSHRAIYGFGIGDEVAEGDCAASSGWTDEYLAEYPDADLSLPVGFTAKTLEDAKRMAIAFADSVG